MKTSNEADFKRNYKTRLKLKGLQPSTIDAYARAIGAHFDYRLDDLSEAQLTGYFSDLLDSRSWSVVKHDLYGLNWFISRSVAPGKAQHILRGESPCWERSSNANLKGLATCPRIEPWAHGGVL